MQKAAHRGRFLIDALSRAFSVSTVPFGNPLKRRLREPFFAGIYQKILINT